MKNSQHQVLCLGLMVADLVVSPVTQECFRIDTSRLKYASLLPGGDALNEATVLARLGIGTAIIGRVGCDLFGDFLIDQLASTGVDTNNVRRDEAVGTAITVVLSQTNGERNFLYFPGATANLAAEDINEDVLSQYQMLTVGSAFGLPALDGEGMTRVMAQAQALGVTTALDTTWNAAGGWLSTLQPVLQFVDFFMPSLYEAQALVGDGEPTEVAARLAALGPSVIIIKLGADGCYVHTADQSGHMPPLPSNVVDTTGAGDSFVGGFLAGQIRGWTLADSVRLGHAAAACCVEEIGATAGIRSWEQVYARYQTR